MMKPESEFDNFRNKFSSLIEELNLSPRAIHMLRRAGVRTVSKIIVLGKSKILSIKNIGALSSDQIFMAVAEHLGIPDDMVSSDGIKRIALETQEKTSSPSNVPVTDLDLPSSLIHLLKNIGVLRLDQLIKFRANNYGNSSQLGNAEAKKIGHALKKYVGDFGKSKVLEGTTLERKVDNLRATELSPLKNLYLILAALGLNERAWFVLELRSIHCLTLEEIAAEIGGVTRERVRQIIDQINGKIRGKFYVLLFLLDFLNEQAKLINKRHKNKSLEVKALAEEFRLLLLEIDFIATKEDVERFIAIIRFIVISGKFWERKKIEETYKDLTFLVCFADPIIEKHENVQRALEMEKERNRKFSYKEIAYIVLSEAKKPLHWRDVAERAYKLNKKERFETRALYHALLSHEEVFVRVGQGTYELAEWGSKQVEPYTEIVASVLQQENQAIPFDSIFSKVSLIRLAKQQSLSMCLDMHPRFYKSIDNTYGLRGWLPPREAQNLRTPEWLIEDSKSIERVERARQRGYDIESIIAEDKLK